MEAIKGKSFLVTGGAGFIGSNIVEVLLANGAKKVRILDNLSNGHLKNIRPFMSDDRFEFLEGDIRDLSTCHKAVHGIEYVTHQAALGSVPRSINDPITTNEVNVGGFLNMLVAVKESDVKRFVYAASSSTYGDHKALPKVEDRIGKPLSPYAVTKYVNELYADVFAKTYGVQTIGLRYFNIFGPRQDPNGAYAAVIPLFMKAIYEGESAVMNGDGSHTRDFTYVANAVQANLKAFFASDESVNEVYNVAVGDRTSLMDLWDNLLEISGKDIPVKYGEPRLGDVKDSLADISKIKKGLGYAPTHNISKGLKETYEWFVSNIDFVNS